MPTSLTVSSGGHAKADPPFVSDSPTAVMTGARGIHVESLPPTSASRACSPSIHAAVTMPQHAPAGSAPYDIGHAFAGGQEYAEVPVDAMAVGDIQQYWKALRA